MNIATLAIGGIWSGLLSGAVAILLSVPIEALAPAAGAGLLTRIVRDAALQGGASPAISTFIAAAAAVIALRALIQHRRPGVSPVVLLSGLIPLGAAKPFFDATIGLIKAPLLTGEALAAAPAEVMADLVVVFTLTFALALGVAIGALISETGKTLFLSKVARTEMPR